MRNKEKMLRDIGITEETLGAAFKTIERVGETLGATLRGMVFGFDKKIKLLPLILKIMPFEIKYMHTGNIIYALKMMTIYREAGQPPSDEVVGYMFDLAERMVTLFENDTSMDVTGKRFEKLVTDAFFDNDKGAMNAREYQSRFRNWEISKEVEDTQEKIKAGKIRRKTGENAYEIVGKNRNMSASAVKKICLETKKEEDLSVEEYSKINPK